MNAIATAPKPEIAKQLPITHLRDSQFQKERVSKRGNLEELAASMKEVGVLEPLIVRPADKNDSAGEELYEIAAGHRRKRAAAIAGIEFVPCIVREYTDDQMLEVCAVENGQRADVHPLDEADLFAELVKRNWSTAQIAAKIGRSPSHVAKRLQLQKLCKEARAALDEERLLLDVAVQLARVPVKLQPDALKQLENHGRDKTVTTAAGAAELIRDRFMLRLAQAPFDGSIAELVPKAGSCTICPKRTGNQTELFSDIDSPDLCTDPTCYRSKLDAHWKVIAHRTVSTGGEVLEGKEADALFSKYDERLQDTRKFQSLDSEVWIGGNHIKVKKLLKGKDYKTTLARNPHTGTIHTLVSASTVAKASSEQQRSSSGGKGKSKTGNAPKLTPAQKAKLERDKLKAQSKRLVTERCIAKIVERVEKLGQKADDILLALIVDDLENSSCEGLEPALERRQGEGDKSKNGSYREIDAALRKYVKNAKESELRAFVVDALLSARLDYMPATEEAKLRSLCNDMKIDHKAIEKQVIAELKAAKDKPANKTATKGTCAECGCTDSTPCETDHGPCCWVDKTETLCSGCAP